jgi:hypothetical protein
MPSFDATFANGQIDFITENSYKMVELYKLLKNAPANPERIMQLQNTYVAVMKHISEYYEYLKKTNVKPEDSYLTHWLETAASPELYEEIEYFLEDCK